MKKFVYAGLILALGLLVIIIGCQTVQRVSTQQEVVSMAASAGGSMPGAIWTSNSGGSTVDQNSYANKTDVYLQGGPNSPKSQGLPNGNYYIKVTEPNGTLLGTNSSAILPGVTGAQLLVVSGGKFIQAYQIWAYVFKKSNSTQVGYDDTTNTGGEYKVWASQDPTFPNNLSKTDNFKVQIEGGPGPGPGGTTLKIIKFYDANTNGIKDNDEVELIGWNVAWDSSSGYTPINMSVTPGTYTVKEFLPIETNWIPTTSTQDSVTLSEGDTKTVSFGNVCIGEGGGLSKGFWGNKNGQALFGADDLALMVSLNLRNADGTNFDPANYSAFKTWLSSANATNMANMLSAQLAAMELSVNNGKINSSALIYAPGLSSVTHPSSFITVNALMTAANSELGIHDTAYAGNIWRAYQEALKTTLDNANNNKTFVMSTPCAFNFILYY